MQVDALGHFVTLPQSCQQLQFLQSDRGACAVECMPLCETIVNVSKSDLSMRVVKTSDEKEDLHSSSERVVLLHLLAAFFYYAIWLVEEDLL